MPRCHHVLKGIPRGIPVFVPARDGKQALAQCSRRTAMRVNIDDQRGPVPRARFASIHVQHNPAGRQAFEGFNGSHDVRFSRDSLANAFRAGWSTGLVHSVVIVRELRSEAESCSLPFPRAGALPSCGFD